MFFYGLCCGNLSGYGVEIIAICALPSLQLEEDVLRRVLKTVYNEKKYLESLE